MVFGYLKLVSNDPSSTLSSFMDFLSRKTVSVQCICMISIHLAIQGSVHGSYFNGTQFHEVCFDEMQFDWFQIESIGFHGFLFNRNDIDGIFVIVAVSQGHLLQIVLISSMNFPSTDFVLKDFKTMKKAFLFFTVFKKSIHWVLVGGVNFHSLLMNEMAFNGFSNNEVQFRRFPTNEINFQIISAMQSFPKCFQSTILVFVGFPLTIRWLHGLSFA